MRSNSLDLLNSTRALGGHSHYSHQERLDAIRQLQGAPPQKAWNEALVLSLTDESEIIRSAGVEACLARLSALKSTPYAQGAFLKTLLDFCFRDLADETEQVRSQLIKKIASFLHAHPLEREYEHLLSHWLTRVQDIQYMHDQETFAIPVIRGQIQFAQGNRSDTGTVATLYSSRRLRAYRTPGVAESTLLAYLDEDYHASFDEGFPLELFGAYRTLLHTQSQGHAEEALLKGFRNLTLWLSQLPQDLEQRRDLIKEANRASKGVPWEELHPDIRLHLEAHVELLPGPNEPHDLFVLLKSKFTHPEGEKILIAGLRTLCYLPGLRERIPELGQYLASEGLRTLSLNVWEAAFELVESLITGLPEAEQAPTPELEPETEQAKAEARRSRRRWARLRKKMLKNDRTLRQWLYDLSSDERYKKEIRQAAWRTLLRLLPQERLTYYSEGLAKPTNTLFVPSLEIAGETAQRQTGELLTRSWETLIAGDQNTAGRRERLQQVCRVLGSLRSLEFVNRREGQDHAPPRLMALALDDPDPEVKQFALNTIYQTGYTTELQREIQRRKLEWLTQEQTRLSKQAQQLDQQLNQLNASLRRCHAHRTRLTLQVQSHLQERDWIVTQGKITTTRLTLGLREVEVQIAVALNRASEQEEQLRRLSQDIAGTVRQSQAARDEMQPLLREQERLARTLERLRGQHEPSRNDIQNAQSALRRLDTQIQDARRSYRYIEDQLDQLQRQSDSHRLTRQAIGQEVNRLDQQANRIRQERDTERQNQQKRLDENDHLLNDSTEQLKQVEAQVAQLSQAITQTNEQLEQCRTSLQQTVEDLTLGRQEYEALTTQAMRENAQVNECGQTEQNNFEDLQREKQESLVLYAHYTSQAAKQSKTVKRG